MKTEDYAAMTPFERPVIDALQKIHGDLVLIEGQLIKLGEVDVTDIPTQ